MAEKKKKNPKFGGKRSLKDTSGDGKITFADTFLGDLLGLDGKVGTKGKAGLLKSLGGARRMKDGVETSKRPKARPKAAEKKAVVKGGRGTPPTAAQIAERSKQVNTPAAETKKPIRKYAKPSGGAQHKRDDKPPKAAVKGGRGTPPTKDQQENRALRANKENSPDIFIKKPKTIAQRRQNLKKITFNRWSDMTSTQRGKLGLPKTSYELRLFTRSGTGFDNPVNHHKKFFKR